MTEARYSLLVACASLVVGLFTLLLELGVAAYVSGLLLAAIAGAWGGPYLQRRAQRYREWRNPPS